MAHDIFSTLNTHMYYFLERDGVLDENAKRLVNMNGIYDLINTNPFIRTDYFGTSTTIEYLLESKVVGIVHEPYMGEVIFVNKGYFDDKDLSYFTSNIQYLIDVENTPEFTDFIQKNWLEDHTIGAKFGRRSRTFDGMPFIVEFDPDNILPPREVPNYYHLYLIPSLIPLGYLSYLLTHIFIYKRSKQFNYLNNHLDKYQTLKVSGSVLTDWDKLDTTKF